MKLKTLKAKEKNYNKDKSKFYENLLFIVCIISFFALVIVQVILTLPTTRDTFSISDKSLGIPLKNDEYLYNQGQLTIRMIGNDPDPTVRILVNGDDIAMFEKLKMDISVKDGDVVEIDGSKSLIEHIITIDSASSNINSKWNTAVANIKSNIQKLIKVQIN